MARFVDKNVFAKPPCAKPPFVIYQKVSMDGAEVALRMRDLEAMARYAAPGLSDRYLQRGKQSAP